MKPVVQTVTEFGKGNCVAACFASLLELPLDEVPNFRLAGMGDAFTEAIETWLNARGMTLIQFILPPDENEFLLTFYTYPRTCILTGTSPRNPDYNHAVVGRANFYGFDIIHDPHPDGGGIVGRPKSVMFIGVKLPS